MSYNSLQLKKFILLIGDIAALYLSLYLTLLIRYGQAEAVGWWPQHFWPFSFIFFLWIIIFYISSLYDLTIAVNNARFYNQTAKALIVSFLLGTSFFYLIPQIGIAPKRNLLINIIITAVLVLVWRNLYNKILKSYLPKINFAIIGINDQVKELIKNLNDLPHLGFRIAFIAYDKEIYEKGLYNIPLCKDIGHVKDYIKKYNVSLIVLADNIQQADELRKNLFSAIRLGVNFSSLNHFYEKIMGKIPIQSINQMWFLQNLNEGSKFWFDRLKKSYDLFLAFFILIASAVFWPLIILIIKLESGGPIFFMQERMGKNNKIIYLIKFRTMRESGNARMPTVPNDPRITRFGYFLRKTRVDEIPQVINIIKGEMSFIGPRPERPEIAAKLQEQIPFYNERTLVLPGITGWDQVCGEYHSPSKEDTIKKLQYDLFYIKNRSLFLDLVIILKTVRTVLLGREASNS